MSKKKDPMEFPPRDDQEDLGNPVPIASSLVPATSTALAAPPDAVMGEGMGPTCASDLVVPRVAIVQPGNQSVSEGATEGRFRSNLGGEKSALHALLLKVLPGQVRWGRFGVDKKPLCKSDDALVPCNDIEKPYCATCNKMNAKNQRVAVCPEAKWTKDRGARVPPACSLLFACVMWDLEEEGPFLMRFVKTGLSAYMAANTRITMLRESIYGVELGLKLILKQEPKPHYRPQLAFSARITDEGRRAAAREAWLMFKDYEFRASDVEEDEVAGDEGGDQPARF
jgi:hypothetical protein